MLKTYEPTHTLKQVGDNIWIVDGSVIKMNFLFIKVPFTTRMTIIRLSNGKLWCHSPIEPHAELFKEINGLGEVAYLISPNKIHYAYINQWEKAYPKAVSFASPGVKERALSQNCTINFTRDLLENPPAEWAGEIDQLIFKGSPVLEEVVFFHQASKVLILTDLIENFEREKTDSRFWKGVQKLGKIAAPDGQTPLDYRLSFTNRKVARACLEKMLSWEPEKIIVAHGRWFEKDGVTELRRAFRWLGKV